MPDESRTSDLIELTRDVFARGSRKDFNAMLDLHAVDAVWDLADAGLRCFEGAEAIRSFIADWLGAFDDYRLDVEEAVDLGNGAVFVVVNARGRPVGVDASVDQRRGWAVLWRNGKIVQAASYLDLDQARAAAERLANERADA